jgi:PAS domain S-box-containing protein
MTEDEVLLDRLRENIRRLRGRTSELMEKEDLSRRVVEGASGFLALVGEDGRILWVNPRGASLFGFESPGALRGRGAADLVDPGDRERFLEALRSPAGPEPAALELNGRSGDAASFPLEGSLSPAGDFDGRPAWVLALRLSDGARREADRLRPEAARLERLLALAADWAWETDPGGLFSFVSSGVENALGYAPSELIGRSPWDFMEEPGEGLREALEGREPFRRLECIFRHKAGRRAAFDLAGEAVFDDGGGTAGHRGVALDARGRKGLESQREALERLLDSPPAAVYLARADADRAVVRIGAGVKDLLGYEPGEVLSEAGFWVRRVHPEDAPRLKAPGSGAFCAEYRFRLKDGSYRWVRDEARVLPGRDGSPAEIAGVLVGVDERKRREAELVEIRSRLGRWARRRSEELERSVKELAEAAPEP